MTPKKKRPDDEDEKGEDERKKFSPRLVESQAALKMLKDDLAIALSPEAEDHDEEEEKGEPNKAQKFNTYTKKRSPVAVAESKYGTFTKTTRVHKKSKSRFSQAKC